MKADCILQFFKKNFPACHDLSDFSCQIIIQSAYIPDLLSDGQEPDGAYYTHLGAAADGVTLLNLLAKR